MCYVCMCVLQWLLFCCERDGVDMYVQMIWILLAVVILRTVIGFGTSHAE